MQTFLPYRSSHTLDIRIYIRSTRARKCICIPVALSSGASASLSYYVRILHRSGAVGSFKLPGSSILHTSALPMRVPLAMQSFFLQTAATLLHATAAREAMYGLQTCSARLGMGTFGSGHVGHLPFAASALPAGWSGASWGVSAGMYLLQWRSPMRLLWLPTFAEWSAPLINQLWSMEWNAVAAFWGQIRTAPRCDRFCAIPRNVDGRTFYMFRRDSTLLCLHLDLCNPESPLEPHEAAAAATLYFKVVQAFLYDLAHVTGVRVTTDRHVAGQHDGVQQALEFLENTRVVAGHVDLDWVGDSQIRPTGFHVQLMPRL